MRMSVFGVFYVISLFFDDLATLYGLRRLLLIHTTCAFETTDTDIYPARLTTARLPGLRTASTIGYIPAKMSDQYQTCINCGINTARSNTVGVHLLEDEAVLSVIQQWIAPITADHSHHVCGSCWNLANASLRSQEVNDAPRVGHQNVCISCGRSVLRARAHLLRTGSQRERRIHDIVTRWILPRRIVCEVTRICHPCWMRADRESHHRSISPSPSTSSAPDDHILPPEQENSPMPPPQTSHSDQRVQTITLPSYIRAIETESRCFIEGCNRGERNRVPLGLRKKLLSLYNYYVPINNRLCDYHLNTETWDFLNRMLDNYVNVFTASHIEDMMQLKDNPTHHLDFGNIFNMEDNIVHNWVGFYKEQLTTIFTEVPQLQQMANGSTGLVAYLMKLRTGDSNERIASLFNIPRRTLESYMHEARELLYEYFVPRHYGLHHINKRQIIERTPIIPKELFGIVNGEEKPVVIVDGTYCYIQKSSNYLYQKRTYSLHKYQNLVKPFLIVCADGYIIDVMGPYPATTTDADIINHEFRNENSYLREYFQPGDGFILDRGFRDALPLLNECGYRTFVPASLEEGETQLSTLEANRSRAVTKCRWVVEVVNGRFKRDFKLLRQDYFNNASKHLMKDFEVAAALINAFHPPITNPTNAGDILRIINQNMHVDNVLGNYIITNNINRRRANFLRLEVQNNNITDFPRLTYSEMQLISLGSYQLKQSWSYYGEHIRNDGKYEIEICRETDSSLLRALSASDTSWLLRGRIKSRHVTNKIYFTYILVDSALIGREAIKQYYCNCLVGKRTVGCCCHTMSIIWYLSWARYQQNLIPPAQMLDDVLITYDDNIENE